MKPSHASVYFSDIDDYVSVDYYFYPASRGRRERSGLQIEPDEDASIELVSVKDAEGVELALTDEQDASIIERLIASMEDEDDEDGYDRDDF